MNVLIIDGYIDEPACFGVSPYVSPYPRYISGALIENGFIENEIYYTTIDEIRIKSEYYKIIQNMSVVIIVAGVTVPGKYYNSKPITIEEIKEIFNITKGIKILGGPIKFGYSKQGGVQAINFEDLIGNDVIISKMDIESLIYDLISKNICSIKSTKYSILKTIDNYKHRHRTNKEIDRWSIKGAFIIKKHPKYPNIICEIETYRGCTRKKHCSFCTEVLYGFCEFRQIKSIVSEINELYFNGIKHIRIGGQADLFAYQGIENNTDVLKPNVKAINELYKSIRKFAPFLETLHMDNVNPLTIFMYPDESKEIIKSIIKYHTPGDVIALGIESIDPQVIRKNNLKINSENAFEVVDLINKIGRNRGYNGMPEILPGVNFLYGLKGETKKTYSLNYEFLLNIVENNLLLRRINIRKVINFKNTQLESKISENIIESNKKIFQYYKEKIRKNIDLRLLKKIFPKGTILKSLFVEKSDMNDNNITFCRQFGTYPILVGVPKKMEKVDSFINGVIIDHGYRSLTAIPYPININKEPKNIITKIPFIDNVTCSKIIKYRPFFNHEDFLNRVNSKIINKEMLKYIVIND